MGVKVVPVSKDEALLNDFAFRCFAEMADADYVAARMAYRASLFPQFHWSSLQALEKYFKAIFLYNRVPAKHLGHSLEAALELTKSLPFALDLSTTTLNFLEYLNGADDRYLVWSWSMPEPKLRQLDQAVWEIRRYARVLNWTGEKSDGSTVNMLQAELDRIAHSSTLPPVRFNHELGLLEVLVHKRLKKNHARKALLWRNTYFGKRARAPIDEGLTFHFVNAPLTLNPHLLDLVTPLVHLPKAAITAYQQYLEEKKRNSQNNP